MRDPQSSSLSNACRRNCVRELHREAPRFQCLPSSVGLLEAFWRMIGGSPCLCCPANVQLSLVSLLSARPKSAPLPSIEYADDKALLFICLKISVMLGPLLRLFGESKCKFTTRSKTFPAIRPFFYYGDYFGECRKKGFHKNSNMCKYEFVPIFLNVCYTNSFYSAVYEIQRRGPANLY